MTEKQDKDKQKILRAINKMISCPSIRCVAEVWINIHGYEKIFDGIWKRIEQSKTENEKTQIKKVFDEVKKLKEEGYKPQ